VAAFRGLRPNTRLDHASHTATQPLAPVDVYSFQAAIESFVAPVLHRFQVQYPNVMFNIRVSSTDETIEARKDLAQTIR
jgi:DNA-binding transcriptional LysR family regulator